MSSEGPEIERLLRRLAECPGEFLQIRTKPGGEGADAIAIICDHIRSMSAIEPPERSTELEEVRQCKTTLFELFVIICWMLHDDWFLQMPNSAPEMWKLLQSTKLKQLVDLVKPTAFVHDADRREELARLCLHSLSVRPKGETAAQAADRLTALDSVERHRVLKSTAAAERRAREIREAMARKKAQESASRYSE